jgi:hypothetical protein
MKTHALFFLTLALLCALFTAPAAALTPPPPAPIDVSTGYSPVNITGEDEIETDQTATNKEINIQSGGKLTIKAGTGGSSGKLTLSGSSKLTIQEGGILII